MLWIHQLLVKLGLIKHPWHDKRSAETQRRQPRTITIDEQGAVTVEAPTAATIRRPTSITRATSGEVSIELPDELILEGDRQITVQQPAEVVIEDPELSLIEQPDDAPAESGLITIPYPKTVTIFDLKTMTMDPPRGYDTAAASG